MCLCCYYKNDVIICSAVLVKHMSNCVELVLEDLHRSGALGFIRSEEIHTIVFDNLSRYVSCVLVLMFYVSSLLLHDDVG